MSILSVVVVLYVVIFIGFEVETAKSGPYLVSWEKIEQCEDQGTKELVWYNLTKQENGNYKVNLHLGRPMDKNLKICIQGQEITSKNVTKFLQFNCKTCGETWTILGDFFSSLMVATGLQPEVCGFKQGNFTAINWNASRPFTLIPVMNYNYFIFTANNYIGDEKIGCNIYHVRIIPK